MLFGESESRAVPAPAVTHHRGVFRSYATLEQWLRVLPLRQESVGRILVPRLECWHGDRPYAFGGRVVEPQPWPDLLGALRYCVEDATGEGFDSCFANYYRNGRDHIPWHADDDAWIGPVIASVTFGARRSFMLRSKHDHKALWSHELGNGDLFVMHAGVQRAYEHKLPPSGVDKPRLNLTFRQTVK